MNHIVQLGKLQAGGIKVLEALEGVEKILSSSVNLGHCLARDVWPPYQAVPEQILVEGHENFLFPQFEIGNDGSYDTHEAAKFGSSEESLGSDINISECFDAQKSGDSGQTVIEFLHFLRLLRLDVHPGELKKPLEDPLLLWEGKINPPYGSPPQDKAQQMNLLRRVQLVRPKVVIIEVSKLPEGILHIVH